MRRNRKTMAEEEETEKTPMEGRDGGGQEMAEENRE